MLNASAAQTVVPPGVTGDANRGFAATATVSNSTNAPQTITVTIAGAAASKFPGYFEAKDYGNILLPDGSLSPRIFRCAPKDFTNGGGYYDGSSADLALLVAPSFTCAGTLPAGKSSVITISSGSKIGSSGTSQKGTAWSLNVTSSNAPAMMAVSGVFS